MRDRVYGDVVYTALLDLFKPGERVLDIGCGGVGLVDRDAVALVCQDRVDHPAGDVDVHLDLGGRWVVALAGNARGVERLDVGGHAVSH
jgi:hypothetical protein